MISARPVTAASGSPPAIPLAVVTRSGTTPSWSEANQSPVRQNPVWISSAMSRMPCSRQNSASPGRKPSGGTMKPPSPWIGSMMTAATLSSPTCVWMSPVITSSAFAAHASGPPGERPELVLVRHVLGGQGHGQVGPAVVGVVERDDRRPAGGVPGDLDGVLHRFRPGVEQRGALVVVTGGPPGELLADRHVLLVRGDHETGVGEPLGLLTDSGRDAGRAVAHRRHRDPRAEVDQGVAVDVDQ